eukprot:COSAG02_NODE_63134_length_264_cov_0.612121_1_plen_23_part_01
MLRTLMPHYATLCRELHIIPHYA